MAWSLTILPDLVQVCSVYLSGPCGTADEAVGETGRRFTAASVVTVMPPDTATLFAGGFIC